MDYTTAKAIKTEYARLCAMTSFQRANERAERSKAAAWRAYEPLSKKQLVDSLDERDFVTLVMPRPNGEIASAGRSSRILHADDGEYNYIHLRLVRRPTELLAVLHALGFLTLDSDFVVVRQEPFRELRYCIYHKTHHIVTDFVPSRKYLNGLSFACRKSLADAKQGIWQKVS